nr:ATP-binding protein [uncultured Pedobacter sp.]
MNKKNIVLLSGKSGTGKTHLILETLKQSNRIDVSIYTSTNEYSDIDTRFSVKVFPSSFYNEEHLLDFKKLVASDLLNDRFIIIDNSDSLIPPGTSGSDLFHLSSLSTIIIATQYNSNHFFRTYPLLERIFHQVIDVTYKMQNPLFKILK